MLELGRVCSLEESWQFAVILKLMSMVNGQETFNGQGTLMVMNQMKKKSFMPSPKLNNARNALVLLTSRQLQKQEAAELVIIGGMVLDIHATPSIPVNPRTTTPGKVNYVLGCVARNVTECMSKLGAKPYMISALGLDMAGDFAFYFVVS
ncbi:hypothetical protein WN943_006324 [Citrus x changshan-huyou]